MNRRVLITGATGALGQSVVRRFLADGDAILAVGERESAIAQLVSLAPGRVAGRRTDLSQRSEVDQLIADWHAEAGSPPTVVHLVGGFRAAPLRDLTDEDWSFLLRINLETTYRVIRAAAAILGGNPPGCLVAASSPAALAGGAGVAAYSASKAAALRLVESLAHEIGPAGGRANTVLPGTMDTAANRAAMPDADRRQWVSTETVAEVIHYLASPAAAGINGAAVRVEGPV
jgi:NAD(P)-dependent dehydrogenase (short-subunit alcohol dehydrogenase family)